MREWTDAQIDAWYARNYYGPGTDYFDPPEDDDEEETYEDDWRDWDGPSGYVKEAERGW